MRAGVLFVCLGLFPLNRILRTNIGRVFASMVQYVSIQFVAWYSTVCATKRQVNFFTHPAPKSCRVALRAFH